jgi:hypothetical protein
VASWGFACQCSICRQPASHVAASDKRLRMIKALKILLNDWTEDQPDRVQMAELLTTLYEQERLHVPIATAYEAAAYAYSVMGDEYKAMERAALAVEAMTIFYGADHPLTLDLEMLMLNPKEHRTWLYTSGVTKKDKKKKKKQKSLSADDFEVAAGTAVETETVTETATKSSSSGWSLF